MATLQNKKMWIASHLMLSLDVIQTRAVLLFFGGLEQIVEYILNLHFDESDISYLRSQGIFSEEFFSISKRFLFHR